MRPVKGNPPLLGRRVDRLWRWQHRDGCRAHRESGSGASETVIVYRRDREHMPAHAFEADEAIEEGVKIKWLTTIHRECTGSDLTVEKMELGRGVAARSATGEVRDAFGRRGGARARPADRFQHIPAGGSRPHLHAATAPWRSMPGSDDRRRPASFAGRRHGAGRPVRDHRHRPGQARRAPRSTPGSLGTEIEAARTARRWSASTCCTFRSIPMPSGATQIAMEAARRVLRKLRRDHRAGLSETRSPLRGAALLFLRPDCYECDNCIRRLPRGGHHQTRPGPRRYTLGSRQMHRLLHLFLSNVPCHAIEMIPEEPGSMPDPNRAASATMDGNQRGGPRRLPSQRGLRDLSDHPVFSTMAEHADEWTSMGLTNIWGNIPVDSGDAVRRPGRRGRCTASLQAGALTTTFTASQGLLLMIPNMFKIAGELTPAVFHVAAQGAWPPTALSIFGDHSDVMAARSDGLCHAGSSEFGAGSA